MKIYRNAIALFGFVIPTVITAALVGTAFVAKSKIAGSFDEKLGNYRSFEQNRKAALALEAAISKKRAVSSHWEELLARETASAVSSNLNEIEEHLPSKEFKKAAQDFPPARGGFAAVSAQKSSQVRLAFRATFRSMQRAFLELESRMPQLQLQELRINPSNSSNSLNFDVVYTAWEP